MSYQGQDANGQWWQLTFNTDGTLQTTAIDPPAVAPQQTSALSSNAIDLISSALRLIGVLASGEVPTASEANDSLMVLNQMLDSWNTERLTIPNLQPQTFALTSGKQDYTVGEGGSFDMVRPTRIERVSVRINNAGVPLEYPLESISYEAWSSIAIKNFSSTYPQKVWDDDNFPLRGLHFWPIPAGSLSAILYCWSNLQAFPDLTTVLNFPPGYMHAIRYNLAGLLSAEFSQPLSPVVMGVAQESKARIRSLNAVVPDMTCDSPMGDSQRVGYVNRAAFYAGGL